MIQWQTGDYPAQIWGFLDLTGLPTHQKFPLADGTMVGKGFWAIVESASYKKIPPNTHSSELFRHLILDTAETNLDGSVKKRLFYVVDVESFKQRIVVIPKVGTKKDYIMMESRDSWADQFIEWIKAPHEIDQEEMLQG